MAENIGPGPQHLLAFGAIVQWFAKHEYLMQTAMAALTGRDLVTIMVLTAGLSYTAKRDALSSLTHTVDMPDNIAEPVRKYLDTLNKHNALRNSVAHSMWVQGTRQDAIKPMRLIVRGGQGKPVGHIEDERDYTAEELLQAASEIAEIYHKFVEFLIASKLVSDFPHPPSPIVDK